MCVVQVAGSLATRLDPKIWQSTGIQPSYCTSNWSRKAAWQRFNLPASWIYNLIYQLLMLKRWWVVCVWTWFWFMDLLAAHHVHIWIWTFHEPRRWHINLQHNQKVVSQHPLAFKHSIYKKSIRLCFCTGINGSEPTQNDQRSCSVISF